jgi:hypothetical protein
LDKKEINPNLMNVNVFELNDLPQIKGIDIRKISLFGAAMLGKNPLEVIKVIKE